MISTENLTVAFSGKPLFEDINIKFVNENCYGLIGANGAGKSTFLKVLSGEIESTHGQVHIDKNKRMAVLKQNHFEFDDCKVFDTVLMGHDSFYKLYAERAELYSKADMTDEEGLRIGDLEAQYGDIDGYTLESDAGSLLNSLGISDEFHEFKMNELNDNQKVKVLLAQALFGDPDILLLDEPTNQLDYTTILWLEEFLIDFKNTVIVVSHDRHFLNKVCTHIADIDYRQIKLFVGNYDFWQKSSELIAKQKQDQHKKQTDKIKELEEFVRRFSANASKSKQATSRKKLIDKIKPEELAVSTRRYPYINFKPHRECGKSVLKVTNLNHSINGKQVLKDVSFSFNQNDKVILCGKKFNIKYYLITNISWRNYPR